MTCVHNALQMQRQSGHCHSGHNGVEVGGHDGSTMPSDLCNVQNLLIGLSRMSASVQIIKGLQMKLSVYMCFHSRLMKVCLILHLL